VVIPWLTAATAFTAPGPYIFFTRALYQLCPNDETTAFVIAHEMAHHDLGHLRIFPKWLGRLAKARGVDIPFGVIRAVEHRLYGPERECDADDYSLRLCVKAGYDGLRCLRFFQILENYALNMKQDEAVYGPDPESDEELSPHASFVTKARIWAYQRSRGYLPIRDRRQRLEHLLNGTV
jgi:predicted Zn-dependent protease